MTAALGFEPYEYEMDESDGKVTTEWIARFDDGAVATVYDWKRYDEGAPGMDEVYDWHIGGTDGTGVADRIRALVP